MDGGTKLLCVVCGLTATLWINVISGAKVKINPDDFLSKYSYYEPGTGPGEASHSEETRKFAIRKFQEFNHLKQTGELDKATIKKMQAPRCGLPDFSHDQPQAFSAPGLKWDSTDVTYRFEGFTRQLPQSYQRRAIYNALSKWSDVTPLTFRESRSSDADILINYVSSSHGDGSPFDGRGGTLAHAFFPGTSGISGDTHFDNDEQWTQSGPDGTNLEIVAAHEFGHALGLSHSSVQGALMAPFYQYDPNYSLHRDDISGIQSLYGSRRSVPRPTPRPRVTTRRPRYTTRRRRPVPTRRPPTRRPPVRRTTTRRPRPRPTRPPGRRTTKKPSTGGSYCDMRFDDIANGPDNSVYVFRQKQVFKLKSSGNGIERGFPKSIRKVFQKAPKNIGAAVYDRTRSKFYIFKGKKYWRYTPQTSKFNLDAGYPKRLNGFFVGINAAVQSESNEIRVLKKDKMSVWREDFKDAPRGYPIDIGVRWNGLRSDLDAAIRYRGVSFFFKGPNYFRYNDRYRRVDYRRGKKGAWLGCGPAQPK